MRLALIGLLMLGGCSTIQLSCPPDRIATATLDGPDYVGALTQLATLAVSAAAKAPLMMAKAPVPASQDNGTMTIKTLAWGQQSYSCGSTAPITPTAAPAAALKAPVPDDPPAAYRPSALPLAIIHG